mmetsp:Transcript_7331/g.23882  ORF Transcript_7331/g.23882 Transcript_7331/m.23882 type:complete len:445 (+) Transcript_7331:1525-2859(+)
MADGRKGPETKSQGQGHPRAPRRHGRRDGEPRKSRRSGFSSVERARPRLVRRPRPLQARRAAHAAPRRPRRVGRLARARPGDWALGRGEEANAARRAFTRARKRRKGLFPVAHDDARARRRGRRGGEDTPRRAAPPARPAHFRLAKVALRGPRGRQIGVAPTHDEARFGADDQGRAAGLLAAVATRRCRRGAAAAGDEARGDGYAVQATLGGVAALAFPRRSTQRLCGPAAALRFAHAQRRALRRMGALARSLRGGKSVRRRQAQSGAQNGQGQTIFCLGLLEGAAGFYGEGRGGAGRGEAHRAAHAPPAALERVAAVVEAPRRTAIGFLRGCSKRSGEARPAGHVRAPVRRQRRRETAAGVGPVDQGSSGARIDQGQAPGLNFAHAEAAPFRRLGRLARRCEAVHFGFGAAQSDEADGFGHAKGRAGGGLAPLEGRGLKAAEG